MNCPNCLNKYNNQNNFPRILNSCGHTFCEDCLKSLLIDFIRIICPQCQSETQIEDVNLLTKNIAILDNSMYFSVLTESSVTNAIANTSFTSIVKKKNSNFICNIHSKDLEAFCETDKTVLCVSCIIDNDHRSHDLSSVDKAAQKERAILGKEIERVYKMEEEIKEKINLVEIKKVKIRKSAESNLKEIEEFFNEIILHIKERSNLLRNKIEYSLIKQLESLNRLNDKIKLKIKTFDEVKTLKNNLDSFSELEILTKAKENTNLFSDILNKNKNMVIPHFNEINFHQLIKEEEIELIKNKVLINIDKFTTDENIFPGVELKKQFSDIQAKIEKIEKIESVTSSVPSTPIKNKKSSISNLNLNEIKNLNPKPNFQTYDSNNKILMSNSKTKFKKSKTIQEDDITQSIKGNNKPIEEKDNSDFNFVKKKLEKDFNTNKVGVKKLNLFPSLKSKSSKNKIKVSIDLTKQESVSILPTTNELFQNKSLGSNQDNSMIEDNLNFNSISVKYDLDFFLNEIEKDKIVEDKINFSIKYLEENNATQNLINQNTPLQPDVQILDLSKLTLNFSKSFQNDMASLYQNSNSFILLLGGKSDSQCRKFCLESDTWSSYNLNVERNDFSAVNYKDKKILIMGGKIQNQIGVDTLTDTIELLNTKDQTVKKLDIKMKYARQNFGVVYMNSKLYVAGGSNGKDVLNNFEFFDKRNKMWIDLPKMLIKRKEFQMILGLDNCIYAIGGSDEREFVTKSVEKFDFEKCMWTKIEDMNQKRKGCSVVCMPDGLYVLGGYDGCQYLKSVEKYDFYVKKWKYVQDMNYPRCFFSSCASYDFQYIYSLGGYDGKPLRTVERYDIYSGLWELLQNLPLPKYRHQCIFLSE